MDGPKSSPHFDHFIYSQTRFPTPPTPILPSLKSEYILQSMVSYGLIDSVFLSNLLLK